MEWYRLSLGFWSHELDLNQYLRATFRLVDCDGSVVLLIIVRLESIAFRRNTSCLLVVLCIRYLSLPSFPGCRGGEGLF